MSTTFLGTTCNAWIYPEIKISSYDPESPTGTVVTSIKLNDPSKKYKVLYYDRSTGEVYTFNGYFRKAIVRADIISSGMVDLTTSGCPNLIESLIFDYSESGHASVKILDVTNIRSITPLLG